MHHHSVFLGENIFFDLGPVNEPQHD
jgi:hypothetical protein